jgi:hypothetical protein
MPNALPTELRSQSVRVCDISEQNLVSLIPMESSNQHRKKIMRVKMVTQFCSQFLIRVFVMTISSHLFTFTNVLGMKRRQFSQCSTYVLVASISLKSLVMVLKVAPYKFRSVSQKFCPRARLIVQHATHVVDVAHVAGFLKLRHFLKIASGLL